MRDFINARLNKDNLFNGLFFLLFFMSLALGYIVPQPLGVILALVMFASAVLLVKVGSPLTFDKEKMEFTTSIGKKTKHIGLVFFFLVVASAFLGAVIATPICDTFNITGGVFEHLIISFFTALFAGLYCVIRNLPIAVYFKKEAWTSLELTGGSSYSGFKHASSNSNSFASSHHRTSSMQTSAYSSSHKSYSGSSRGSIITSPTNRAYSSNIFNR